MQEPKSKPGHSPPPPGTFAAGELPGGGAVAVASALEYGPKRSGRSASRAPPPVGLENAPAPLPGTRRKKKKKKKKKKKAAAFQQQRRQRREQQQQPIARPIA